MTPDSLNPKSPPESPNMDAFQCKGFLRLPQVLALIPISRSMVGRVQIRPIPQAYQIGVARAVWKTQTSALVESLSKNEGANSNS